MMIKSAPPQPSCHGRKSTVDVTLRPPALTVSICAMCHPRRRGLRDIRQDKQSRRGGYYIAHLLPVKARPLTRWLAFRLPQDPAAQKDLGISAAAAPCTLHMRLPMHAMCSILPKVFNLMTDYHSPLNRLCYDPPLIGGGPA